MDGWLFGSDNPVSSALAVGLVPRFVMPWQRNANRATADQSGQPAAGRSGQLEAVLPADVLPRALVGDEAAEHALFDAYATRVFRLAWRMTGDTAAAEDLVQDVFARVFDRLHQYRGDAPFGAWLHQVAVSTILNGVRRRRVTRAREAPLEEASHATAASQGLEPDVRDRVRRALHQLPAPLRLVVVMFDIEGYSHDDIAGSLGITTGASRVRLSRARDALRAALAMDATEWSS